MGFFNNENQPDKANLNKSRFNLSHQKLITDDMGSLIPILIKEVIPGDEIDIDSEIVIRMAPLVAPAFSFIDVNIRYFYTQCRIVQDGWKDFIMGTSGKTIGVYNALAADINDNKSLFEEGSLLDYFGGAVLPTGIVPQPDAQQNIPDINMMPFRAYHLIYQEYYRPKEIEYKQIPKHDDFEDSISEELKWLLSKQYVTNFGDYFSSAKVDVSNVDVNVPATIEELKNAEGIYRFFQKLKYTGKKYADYLRAFFGMDASAQDLDIPVYLGGKSSTIQIQEVMQTVATEDLPLGNYAGKGEGYMRVSGEKLYAKEHGYLIALMDVTPRVTYAGGHSRMLTNNSYYDFYQPMLETMYRSTIRRGEAHFPITGASPYSSTAYAYCEPYHHLKYAMSQAHGKFKNQFAYWSAIQRVNDTLDDALLYQESVNRYKELTEDMFAIEDEPQFYAQIFHQIDAIRPLKRSLFI